MCDRDLGLVNNVCRVDDNKCCKVCKWRSLLGDGALGIIVEVKYARGWRNKSNAFITVINVVEQSVEQASKVQLHSAIAVMLLSLVLGLDSSRLSDEGPVDVLVSASPCRQRAAGCIA